jgi:hypothetical protein
MRATLLYRIAAVLLVLFAIGHTVGFRQVDPGWGVDAPLAALKNTRFQVQGFTRTYLDFFNGFGFFVTVLLLFAAVLAWQLGALPPGLLAEMPLVTWGFAACMLAVTALSFRYFFAAPAVLSAIGAVCLVAAAWAARPG